MKLQYTSEALQSVSDAFRRQRLLVGLIASLCTLAGGCASAPESEKPGSPLVSDRREAIDPETGIHATIVYGASAIPRKDVP